MRLNTKGKDVRRRANPIVILLANFATPQTPFCVQTLRAGHALRAWCCYSPLVWNNQTARFSPSPARNAGPAYIRFLLK